IWAAHVALSRIAKPGARTNTVLRFIFWDLFITIAGGNLSLKLATRNSRVFGRGIILTPRFFLLCPCFTAALRQAALRRIRQRSLYLMATTITLKLRGVAQPG